MGAKVQSLKHFPGEAAARHFASLVDAAENEALPLVEQRSRSIEAGIVAVLRRQCRLQIGESSMECDHVYDARNS